MTAAHNKRVGRGQVREIQGTIIPFNGPMARFKSRFQAEGTNVRFLDTALPEQVESVWLLNDSKNKKERVSAVLEHVAGLSSREADRVMMLAHTQGAGLIAILPTAEAQDLAKKVISFSRLSLSCTSVSHPRRSKSLYLGSTTFRALRLSPRSLCGILEIFR